MNSEEHTLLSGPRREAYEDTFVVRERLEVQFENLEHQRHAAAFGMWVFLATEVMFFGALFVSVGVYRYLYTDAVEAASKKLNWQIGGVNSIVLLVSSLTMALALHYAKLGRRRPLMVFLGLTAFLGTLFLALKGLEYYTDYLDYLIPNWRFRPEEWILEEGLAPDQVPRVELFLMLYWIMTGLHVVHLTIGICAVLTMFVFAARGHFNRHYYSPIEVTGLYWSFVDIVWIFLLPLLYLQGTHTW
jgi:cytochrome c oxidase subunit 3